MRYWISIAFIGLTLLGVIGIPLWSHECSGKIEAISILLKPSDCAHDNEYAGACSSKSESTDACCSLTENEDSCCSNELNWEPSDIEQFVYDNDQFDQLDFGDLSLYIRYQKPMLPRILRENQARPPPDPPRMFGALLRAQYQIYIC